MAKPLSLYKDITIPIGSRFGLWEITGHTSLSSKNRVVIRSKYPCLCHNCGKTYQVQHQTLITGRSTGCSSCKLKMEKHKPSPSNPECPNCSYKMAKRSEWCNKSGIKNTQYVCYHCKHSETIRIKP